MDEPAPGPDDSPGMRRSGCVTQRQAGFDPVGPIEGIGKAIVQPATPTQAP